MITKQPLYLQRVLQSARTPGFLLFVGGYAALLAWFKIVDVYHLHFATSGASVLIYNGFRILFIFYLFWIIWAPGALALRWLSRKSSNRTTLECLVLNFFAGAGLWHIAMLALGYLNLYTGPIAIANSFPAVALSYPSARDAISHSWHSILAWHNLRWERRLTIVGIGFAGPLLLLIKGLYPGGGHDYYNHYFYYYQAVIDHGGLWPNEVWYHYYYSKGCGLFFLSMLLTDPLAPQLVTFCFMTVAAATLYLAVNDVAPRTNWPAASVLLFTGFYILTPGWGEFEKDHEFNTALIIGVVWMTQRALQEARPDARFIIACSLAITAAVIINTQIGAFFLGVFALLALLMFAMDLLRATFICAALAVCAGIVITLVLILNYTTTGLFIDQAITRLWAFADVEKLYELGTLPMVLNLYVGTKGLIAEKLPFLSRESYKLIVQSLRLDLLFPLVGLGASIAGLTLLAAKKQLATLRANLAANYTLAIAVVCLLVCVGIALSLGRTQAVSFHRYSTFAVPIVILLGVTLWTVYVPASDAPLFRIVQNRWAPLAVTGFCLGIVLYDVRFYRHLNMPADALMFAVGRASIDDAYVRKGTWPYHLPWGGIHPGARAAYAIVGPRTPIWSLHVHTYCMLPGCLMEEFFSFNMTAKWDRVMFGSADEARRDLQAAGINYFLFSSNLTVTDPLPLSSLFSPDHIAEHLALRWTDGTSSLLTWSGPETRPLDDAWVATYRKSVKEARAVQDFPLAAMRGIYDAYYAMPHPWKPIPLP